MGFLLILYVRLRHSDVILLTFWNGIMLYGEVKVTRMLWSLLLPDTVSSPG